MQCKKVVSRKSNPYNADLNVKVSEDWTALMWAVKEVVTISDF